MKIVIRILIQATRIRLPEKVWIAAQQQSDSNLSSTDSNPNSNKRYFDWLIRITIQVIRIPGEKKVKLRAMIRITHIAIRIPHEEQGKAIRIFELWIRIPSQIEAKDWKSDRAIRILELWIRITSWRKIQILQRWFESPKQWFELVTL